MEKADKRADVRTKGMTKVTLRHKQLPKALNLTSGTAKARLLEDRCEGIRTSDSSFWSQFFNMLGHDTSFVEQCDSFTFALHTNSKPVTLAMRLGWWIKEEFNLLVIDLNNFCSCKMLTVGIEHCHLPCVLIIA